MNIIITGTSRGIGLELTRKAINEGHRVLAIARNPEGSPELMALKNPQLTLLKLDLTTSDSHERVLEAIKDWPHVDVLINNAGIYLDDKERKNFEASFLTNSIVPYFLTRALLPKLREAKRPLSFQITSQMGSISDNSSGGSSCYRASKAALNMLFKGLSIDEPWLTSLQVHPGWVQTDMGGEHAPITVQESVTGLWKLVKGADLKQSGTFLSYLGEDLPW